MRQEEFSEICRAVAAGDNVFVQNVDLLYSGRVVACGSPMELLKNGRHSYTARCLRKYLQQVEQ